MPILKAYFFDLAGTLIDSLAGPIICACRA